MKLPESVTEVDLLERMTLAIKDEKESLPWALVPWQRRLVYENAGRAALAVVHNLESQARLTR